MIGDNQQKEMSIMTKNKKLLTKLANLGVLNTEPIKSNSFINDNDIIITKYDDSKEKVIIDEDTTNEELLLMVEAEKLSTLKYIKSVVKAYVVGCVVVLVIWLINFLIQWGDSVARM